MRIKLTERAVERIKAPTGNGKQALHWDAELKGFGVLCSGVSKTKTYVVQRDVAGRTRRVTIAQTNVLSLGEARRRAEAVLADFYLGRDPKAGRRGSVTLRGALADYLVARKNLRPKSVDDYCATIERHLGAWLDRPLREITPEMVEARHRAIAAEVLADGRYSGEASANGAMRTLRLLWNFAKEREPNLPENPVARLRRQWYPISRRERMVRADDLPAFYRAALALPNPVHRDYLLLLLFTGLRRSEAATLAWTDIDFGQRVIRIPAARTKAGRKLDLPMSDIVQDLLVARRAAGDAKFIFPSNSASGHVEEPKFPLRLVAASCGIEISAHDLRRTFITIAESTDISPLALKALVNHALGSDVTSGYVQMTTERLREPAQKVADKLKELCGGIAPPEGAVALRRDRP